MRAAACIALLVVLCGCEILVPGSDLPEPGSAHLSVNGGQSVGGTATYTSVRLDSVWYQAVVLEFPTAGRIEIISPQFKRGSHVYTIDAPGSETDPLLVFIPPKDEGRFPLSYWAHSGTLTIDEARGDMVAGSFSLKTLNPASSCLLCPEAVGPSVDGAFSAIERK